MICEESRIGCHCFPASRGYPASLRKGCNGIDQCHVLAEMRAYAKPGGREALQAAYRAESLKAAERAEQVPEQRDVISRLTRLGVPSNDLFVAMANDKPTEAMRTAQLWWRGDRKTFPALVMAGDVGRGKTTAAAWCALEWARHHPWNSQPTGSNQQPFAWIDGRGMRLLGEWGEEAQDLLACAATAELTVIDDAGKEGDRRAYEALSDLLTERVDRNRTTILSSNMKGEMFRARYGIALADRLRARAVMPSLKGDSMRARVS